VSDDISKELFEIGKLLDSANMISAVRREVRAAVDQAVVMGGAQANTSGDYDIVVFHDNEGDHDLIARRIRSSMPNVEVERIVEKVIGIRTQRRGSR
jgi:hypothetical protein